MAAVSIFSTSQLNKRRVLFWLNHLVKLQLASNVLNTSLLSHSPLLILNHEKPSSTVYGSPVSGSVPVVSDLYSQTKWYWKHIRVLIVCIWRKIPKDHSCYYEFWWYSISVLQILCMKYTIINNAYKAFLPNASLTLLQFVKQNLLVF